MNNLERYIFQTVGSAIHLKRVYRESLGQLPMFIGERYKLYEGVIVGKEFLLAELKNNQEFSVSQIRKHFEIITRILGKEVVLIMEELLSYNRKRLIEKKIHFIIPDKQMYMPGLFIDLKERNNQNYIKSQSETLLPSAQFIIIYHILNKKSDQQLETFSFKEIAKQLGYTPMAVSMAIDNLKHHEVISVDGEKEKRIHFKLGKRELWEELEKRKLLINPVIKRIFVDEKPKNTFLLASNVSAMPEYTDLNPDIQRYYAIGKNTFYEWHNASILVNENQYEGRYCLEVWKYDPLKLSELQAPDRLVVDPLSLYLSLKESSDERIEMALEQMIDKNIIW